MFHVIVVVGPVRLVACSCGSCNREDRGVDIGAMVSYIITYRDSRTIRIL